MNQVVDEKVVEIFLKQKDYENYDDEQLRYIFIEEIGKLSGDGELLPHHEYDIDYEGKFCNFYDFDIDYENEEKIYTRYQIILKPRPKRQNLLINIFIFNY